MMLVEHTLRPETNPLERALQCVLYALRCAEEDLIDPDAIADICHALRRALDDLDEARNQQAIGQDESIEKGLAEQ
jgi:hypothetical protein